MTPLDRDEGSPHPVDYAPLSPSREVARLQVRIARLQVRTEDMLREVGRLREQIAALRAREIIERADPLADTPVTIHAGAALRCIEMGGVGCCEFGSVR